MATTTQAQRGQAERQEGAGRRALAKAAGGDVSRKGGEAGSYEDWNRDELIDALRNH